MPLANRDVSTEEGRYCPECAGDWRATQIPVKYVEEGNYGHHSPCQKKRSWDDDYDENCPCTCLPQYYSNLIGIETPDYDGVSLWMCPFCETRWNRWTGEEVKD